MRTSRTLLHRAVGIAVLGTALPASSQTPPPPEIVEGLQEIGEQRAQVVPDGLLYGRRFLHGFENPCRPGVDRWMCDTPPEVQPFVSPKLDEYSVSFWFKANDPGDGSAVPLVGKGNHYSQHGGWRFFVEENGGEPWLVFRVCGRDPEDGPACNTATGRVATRKPVEWGTWHHVVGIIDQRMDGEGDSRRQLRLYLDDQFNPIYSGGGGASSRMFPSHDLEIVGPDQPLRVGVSKHPTGVSEQYLNGALDDLRIYRRVLKRDEISELFHEPPDYREETLFKRTAHACYRVPTIIRAADGSLLAFAQRRYGRLKSERDEVDGVSLRNLIDPLLLPSDDPCRDAGNIDIVMRRSRDNGRTWEQPQTVVNHRRYLTGPEDAPVQNPVLSTTDLWSFEAAAMAHSAFTDEQGESWLLYSVIMNTRANNNCAGDEPANGEDSYKRQFDERCADGVQACPDYCQVICPDDIFAAGPCLACGFSVANACLPADAEGEHCEGSHYREQVYHHIQRRLYAKRLDLDGDPSNHQGAQELFRNPPYERESATVRLQALESPLRDNFETLDWAMFGTGPGHATVMSADSPCPGRVVVPIHGGGRGWALIYDDQEADCTGPVGTHSWFLGGQTISSEDEHSNCAGVCCLPSPGGTGSSENQIAEIGGGRLLMSSRRIAKERDDARKFSVSDDGGWTWQPAETQCDHRDAIVHASVLGFPFWHDGEQDQLLAISSPACLGHDYGRETAELDDEREAARLRQREHEMRRNMSVRVSLDDGETWAYSKNVRLGSSGYSDMVDLLWDYFESPHGGVESRRMLGLLYEAPVGNAAYGSAHKICKYESSADDLNECGIDGVSNPTWYDQGVTFARMQLGWITDDREEYKTCDECEIYRDTRACQGPECGTKCGNGTPDPGEECDDDDVNNGDGCSDTCTVEPGWACSGWPSVCAVEVI